jgi:hypothetical protein
MNIKRKSERIHMKLGMRLSAFVLTAVVGVANASTNTSLVLDVRVNASTTTAGNVRVGVEISGTTSCNYSGWYSFEYPDSGPGAATGKLWTAQLLTALASGQTVTIAGNPSPTCDPFGLESVYYIDIL